MKKLLKKATSLLVALVMVLGVMVPAFSVNAAEGDDTGDDTNAVNAIGTIAPGEIQEGKPDKTNLIITKLVADGYNDGIPADHNGGIISDEDLGSLGENVKKHQE